MRTKGSRRIGVAALSGAFLGAFVDAGFAADQMLRKAPAPVDTLHVWVAADYLGWWTKGAPMPPLVTLGDPASANPGALGDPGTRLLFGGSDIGTSMLSGVRLRAGASLTDNLSIEAGGFLLQNRTAGF